MGRLLDKFAVGFGDRGDQLSEFSIEPQLNGYSPPQTIAFFNELHQRLAALPGVESVSAAEIPVFTDSSAGSNINVEGHQAQDDDEKHVNENFIGPDYFTTVVTPV